MIIPALRLRSITRHLKSTDFTCKDCFPSKRKQLIYAPDDFIDRAIWTALETNLGVVCASLPIMDPLLQIILRSPKPAVESARTLENPKSPRNHISVTRTTWHDRTRGPEIDNKVYGCLCGSVPESTRPWSCSAASVISRKALDSCCTSDVGSEDLTIRKKESRALGHRSIAEHESIVESIAESGTISRVTSKTVSRPPSRQASRPASRAASRTTIRTTSRPPSRPTSRTASRTVSRTVSGTASRTESRTSHFSHMQLSRIVRQ